jgi:hypothetical protein
MALPVRIEDGIIRVESGFLDEVERLLMTHARPFERMPVGIAMAAMG